MDRPSIKKPYCSDLQSPNGKIRIKRECIGEIGRFVEGHFWHLNRAFEGRSVFFGSGIEAFIDPHERFLVLRDAGVLLLFDYRDGQSWHAQSPWFDRDLLSSHFPSVAYEEKGITFQWKAFAHQDKLGESLSPGLGPSHDGFLSHWRGLARDEEYSLRLNSESVILQNPNR